MNLKSKIKRFIPLALVTLISVVYAIYTKDSGEPFKFEKFDLQTSIQIDYLYKSLFKLKHIFHYIITYWLGIYAFGKNEHKQVILFCIVLGFLIEILQGFVPTRGGSLNDLIPNILGMLIGYATITVIQSINKGKHIV